MSRGESRLVGSADTLENDNECDVVNGLMIDVSKRVGNQAYAENEIILLWISHASVKHAKCVA